MYVYMYICIYKLYITYIIYRLYNVIIYPFFTRVCKTKMQLFQFVSLSHSLISAD